jgi:hypothetical protein
MLFNIASFLALVSVVPAAPQIKVGKTTFIGRDVTGLKQDFFGGVNCSFPTRGIILTAPLRLQVSRLPNLLLETYASSPQS